MEQSNWINTPDNLNDDEQFLSTITKYHQKIYEQYFLQDLMVNHQLPTTLRAFRHLEQWRLVLILTPWMFARIMVPDETPEIVIPSQWQAQNRENEPYCVLGPAVHLPLLGEQQQAHLNYSPELGHYLLQPLVMNMVPFQNPDEVFEQWNNVIKTRNEYIEKHHRECSWHKEVSRREFFSRFSQ